jgi:hypothetical protein
MAVFLVARKREVDSAEREIELSGLDHTPYPERAAPNNLGVRKRFPLKEPSILELFCFRLDPGSHISASPRKKTGAHPMMLPGIPLLKKWYVA